ncbi:MAG: c-type cytochrome [Gammaproteobacteria bacterium]
MLRFSVLFVLFALTPALLADDHTATGDAGRGQEKSQSCAACHGADGNSVNPVWPKLAGQHPDYTVEQLQAFQSGARENAQMSPMVQGLSEQDMRDIAAFYAAQTPKVGSAKPDAIELGQKIYRAGNAATGVAACMACHGPAGKGIPGAGYPALAGQHSAYTSAQLKAYRSGTRDHGQASIMQDVAKAMTDAEIEAVAEYINGLY